jgi:hypothetical protein
MHEVLIFVLGALLPYLLRVVEALITYMKRELDKENKNA